jgi:hypothetical protein
MANQPNTDIATLQTEIEQLRADFAKLAAGVGQPMLPPAENIWTEVQRQAGSLGREIEERPIAAALTAFGAGILLGHLLNARRG